jgi:hypothetical protein
MMEISVGGLFALFRGQFYHVVDTEDRDCSLGGETDRVYLGDHRLEHACSQVVAGFAVQQVEPGVFKL